MDDQQVLAEIHRLTDEEHRIERGRASKGQLPPEEHDRLAAIEVTLDQCWDLLNQRRARRSAGLDPDEAEVRPPEVVERYQQ
jgi:hypothetical protein